jgi:hypothetical protein
MTRHFKRIFCLGRFRISRAKGICPGRISAMSSAPPKPMRRCPTIAAAFGEFRIRSARADRYISKRPRSRHRFSPHLTLRHFGIAADGPSLRCMPTAAIWCMARAAAAAGIPYDNERPRRMIRLEDVARECGENLVFLAYSSGRTSEKSPRWSSAWR